MKSLVYTWFNPKSLPWQTYSWFWLGSIRVDSDFLDGISMEMNGDCCGDCNRCNGDCNHPTDRQDFSYLSLFDLFKRSDNSGEFLVGK